VTVGPSPAWLRHRLGAIGARSINNVVDVTNYILFELGQPLHAFDTTRVEGGEIRVRRAFDSETLALLDGSEVTLEAEDLVIADARSAVALAGIMGGAGSQISETTHSIFLESANFQPARVRRTSVRIGKRTDSSLRFEKSLDPENAKAGILRAARMLLDLCPGAKVVGPLQDVGYEPAAPIEISTSAAFHHEAARRRDRRQRSPRHARSPRIPRERRHRRRLESPRAHVACDQGHFPA
jgi:phenylalanyl-tRNA synthetase beta chain